MAWSGTGEARWHGPTMRRISTSFRVNRVEPLYIPGLSKLLGPVRYDFFYGSLKGHTAPNSPYTHAEMFSFRPTKNSGGLVSGENDYLRRSVDDAPVTLHTFLNGFLSLYGYNG